ncbi:MAG: hypothetical protein Q4B12_09430 [Bowdeniella nasicola]|nr:hypothetical protein [Bowdeniella nasicola]
MRIRPGTIFPVLLCVLAWLVAAYLSTGTGVFFYLPGESRGYILGVYSGHMALLSFVWIAILCFQPRLPWVELLSPRHFRLHFLSQAVFISILIATVFPLAEVISDLGIGLTDTSVDAPAQTAKERSLQMAYMFFSSLQGVMILSLTLLMIALIGHRFGRLSPPIWVGLYWIGLATGVLFWAPGGSPRFYQDYHGTAITVTIALWLLSLWAYARSYGGIKARWPLN